ncbi:hypothetical protein [Streptomyces sp. NPDC058758]|uniref:hypothetical protein n=1 Tax=Streptomyces sp. NPDC058758 TaxID=3346627 RepID=UPI0036CFD717
MFRPTRPTTATVPALPLLLTACALAFAFAAFLLVAVAAADGPEDDRRSLPRCGTVSSKGSGDYVPAGPRPYVLNTPASSSRTPESGPAPLAPPGAAVPAPAKPTAPAAKPKAPPAPAVKVPAAPRPPSIVKAR